ncbi:epi-neemfruitin B synthase L1AT-like [Rutidosis leptorrhynchoides]|uniref:epi-neemfruitin B synthase L1AT-like n=1 Tax=Rutidosis leptorrhynchoides TaxID=125765 RepID=UPI003A99A31C
MISKLLRLDRRKLHTIVSRNTIKPSSPTPFHSKTYNLSLLDQIAINPYVPIVAIYPSSNAYQSSRDKTLELKNSLSKVLTHYYPFAGRMKKIGPTFIDCNDEGVEFIEACNTSTLSGFLQQSEHEDLDQLFPDDRIWFKKNIKSSNDDEKSINVCPLSVQVNHFTCGGVAVATSLHHTIGDGNSALNFIKHWAAVTSHSRDVTSPIINPHFISYQPTTVKLPKSDQYIPPNDVVSKSFVFSNMKIKELQTKVATMTMNTKQPIINPTRAAVVSWLLHKCVVAATRRISGNVIKTSVIMLINLRNKLKEPLPATSIGNLTFPISNHHGDVMPDDFINQLRKEKLKFQNIRNLETALGTVADMISDTFILGTTRSMDTSYFYSIICGFFMYDIDFGWGKPIKVAVGGAFKNLSILMDASDGNGIEALVSLNKQDIKIVANDPELLAIGY